MYYADEHPKIFWLHGYLHLHYFRNKKGIYRTKSEYADLGYYVRMGSLNYNPLFNKLDF